MEAEAIIERIRASMRVAMSRCAGAPGHEVAGWEAALSSLQDGLGRHMDAIRAATVEECAVAAEAQDRTGRAWVRDSLWAAILKRAGANVRALAAPKTEDPPHA